MAVADGDTVNVRIRQSGGWSVRRDVRLTGVQAMELRSYSRVRGRKGECHAVGRPSGSSTCSRDRASSAARSGSLRFGPIAEQRPAGPAAARDRLQAGRPLARRRRDADARGPRAVGPEPQGVGVEQALRAAGPARGARAGRGIWDTESCRPGRVRRARSSSRSSGTPTATTAANVNGEWIRIRNRDPANPRLASRLVGARLCAAPLHVRQATRSFPPGGSIQVRVGRGQRTARAPSTGASASPVFENAKRRRGIGDGGYLFDPHGDLRAWRMYPCRVGCVGAARRARSSFDASAQGARSRSASTNNSGGPYRPVGVRGGERALLLRVRARDDPAGRRGRSCSVGRRGLRSDTEFVKNWGFKTVTSSQTGRTS